MPGRRAASPRLTVWGWFWDRLHLRTASFRFIQSTVQLLVGSEAMHAACMHSNPLNHLRIIVDWTDTILFLLRGHIHYYVPGANAAGGVRPEWTLNGLMGTACV